MDDNRLGKGVRYTGHPFVDVGVAVLENYLELPHEEFSEENLAMASKWLMEQYVRKDIKGYLTVHFPNSGWCNPTIKGDKKEIYIGKVLFSHCSPPLEPQRACPFCGRPAFYHIQRTGYKHLDEVRVNLAKEKGLQEYDNGKAYQLPLEERHRRLEILLQGLSNINGGAKLALHYTDVSPRLVILALSKGGNHLFSTFVGATNKGLPVLKMKALKEVAKVFKDEILSGIYVGLMQGYLDDQRAELEAALSEISSDDTYGKRKTFLGHPKYAIGEFLKDLAFEREKWLS